MKRFLIRGTVMLLIIFFTPLGGWVRPLLTPKSTWFEGKELAAYGTGFYINENDLITNYRVIATCSEILVGGRDKRTTEAHVLLSNPADDFAVLRTTTRVATPLFLSETSDVELWKTMYYPDYTSEQGAFSFASEAVQKTDDNNLYASIGLRFGNNGAPMIDERGTVIGVNKGWHGEGVLGFLNLTGYTIATPVSTLINFLSQHKIAYTIYPGTPDLLKTPNYRDFLAVNIGCIKGGASYTH
jgi:S1-C subfamily serine protease